jgi:RNA polymerase sigma factor (sigma-70 family)
MDVPFQTQEELSRRLSVSRKTISRWRQLGLSGLRVRDTNKVHRLIFTERSLRRFVAHNRERVFRGGAFRQLTASERNKIIERARELVADCSMKLHDVARSISTETGRAVATIRNTLRRHDHNCSEAALLDSNGPPKVPDCYNVIYAAFAQGMDTTQIARQHGLSRTKVGRIGTEMRAYELITRKLTYVYHPEFDIPDAKRRIMVIPEPQRSGESSKPTPAPSSAPAYLKALYEVPLLTYEQEADLFRRYNYCKYSASRMIQELEPCTASKRQLNTINDLLGQADAFRNRIIRANLRLVVSIANRHLRRDVDMFELISDGNMSLMRAVERFDFSRGFKLSTYATWAIMKNFARTIPEELKRCKRYVTGRDELLDAAPDYSEVEAANRSANVEGLRTDLSRGLKQLDEREREILTCHFGLGDDAVPITLEQLGDRFGVTKERVRQIEKRALAKLKCVLSPSLADHVCAA